LKQLIRGIWGPRGLSRPELVPRIRLLVSLLFGRVPADNLSLGRYGRILRGGATAVIAKMVAAVTALSVVPLTIGHLGPERYGLWASLFSMLAWLSLTDLGLSNGLMAVLTQALARQRRDLARDYVATAFWGLAAIACVVGVASAIAVGLVDWATLMNIHSRAVLDEFRLAIACLAAIFTLGLPFTIVARILIATQRSELASFWAMVNSVASVAGIALAVVTRGGLPALVMGFYGSQLLVSVASAAWLFLQDSRDLAPTFRVSRHALRRVFSIAGSFFVVQIATLMLFQTGNFIIAHHLGPQFVAPYQVTFLLFQYVTLPQQLIAPPVWASIGEAYARGEIAWIRTLFARFTIAGIAFGAPVLVFLVIFAARIVRLWAGESAVPTFPLVLWMAAWGFLLILNQSFMAVLGGIGRLRVFTIFSMIAAGAGVLGGSLAVDSYGPSGVIAASVVSFGLCSMLPAAVLVARILGVSVVVGSHSAKGAP
jgi:O-antigen/teichoic acid export membrane protein